MPVYEYKCRHCGNVHVEIRPISKRDKVSHCQCGYTCKRIISIPGEPKGGPTPKFYRR